MDSPCNGSYVSTRCPPAPPDRSSIVFVGELLPDRFISLTEPFASTTRSSTADPAQSPWFCHTPHGAPIDTAPRGWALAAPFRGAGLVCSKTIGSSASVSRDCEAPAALAPDELHGPRRESLPNSRAAAAQRCVAANSFSPAHCVSNRLATRRLNERPRNISAFIAGQPIGPFCHEAQCAASPGLPRMPPPRMHALP